MRWHNFSIAMGLAFCVVVLNGGSAGSLAGRWKFAVDFPTPSGHGEPTFVFQQKGEKLTGTYKGPLGEYPVTGKVSGATVTFGFDYRAPWDPSQIETMIYAGTVNATWEEMRGTVDAGRQAHGKWVAHKVK
jgi:hypothetical protein